MSIDDALTYPHVLAGSGGACEREAISVRVGPTPLAQIGNGCCVVVYPAALLDDGAISGACRWFVVRCLQDASRPAQFRTCLVWGPNDCTYIEPDTSVDSTEPPSNNGLDFTLPAQARIVICLSGPPPRVGDHE